MLNILNDLTRKGILKWQLMFHDFEALFIVLAFSRVFHFSTHPKNKIRPSYRLVQGRARGPHPCCALSRMSTATGEAAGAWGPWSWRSAPAASRPRRPWRPPSREGAAVGTHPVFPVAVPFSLRLAVVNHDLKQRWRLPGCCVSFVSTMQEWTITESRPLLFTSWFWQ